MSKFEFEDWGLIKYQQAWDKQNEYVSQIQKGERKSTLVFCEHPSVVSIGKNGSKENLLRSDSYFEKNDVDLVWTSRGGDVTMHNPGQLVAYPLFDLKEFKTDLHWFLRNLEEAVIMTISEFGISGTRVDGLTGVWVDQKRKICAMGLHCSRWVTSHGLALNVINDMSEFDYIIPCGIEDKKVTSMKMEINNQKSQKNVLGKTSIGTELVIDFPKDMEKVKEMLKSKIKYIF
jgi:lipoyl(octanoyl) transferase